MARPLVASSIDVILRGQAPSGAYLAAPAYDAYAYSWLRDGAFIAASMDARGRHESAAAFHRWVARTVERHAPKVEALERAVADDLALAEGSTIALDERYVLHTRFTVDGDEGHEEWGEFQLDGYGFWLTSISRHLALTREDAAPFVRAIDLVQRYLARTWPLPCYDCWEEHPAERHVTTWAAVAQGLRASTTLATGEAAATTADEIVRRLVTLAGPSHVLRKFVAATEPIDGSALLILGPFGPFDPKGAVVSATLRAVEDRLVVDGGVHRYLGDEFYGGGLWVVLAGALAATYAPGDVKRAGEILAWIEAQADAEGHLPEQVGTHLTEPASRAAWLERWGPPAQPLLWSHAMYLLGVTALDETRQRSAETRSAR